MRPRPHRLSWATAVLAAAAVVLAGVVLPVTAAPPVAAAPVTCNATLLDAAALARCLTQQAGGSTPGSSAGGSSGAGGGGPAYRYRNVLACLGNTPDAPTGALCPAATGTCTAPQLLYRQFRSLDGVAWETTGTRCLTPAEATAGEAFPGFTAADLARLPLPAADVVLQPGNGYALAQVPVNLMAVAAVAVLPTQLLGFDVTVRATPVSWTWDLGDGTVLGPTSDPGAPYPALDLTHTYTASGSYAVTLTTTYAGEFSVGGGAFAPIAGTASVVSAPVPVTVLAGHDGLVGGALG